MIPGVCQKKGLTYYRVKFRDANGARKDRYIRLPDPAHPLFAEKLAAARDDGKTGDRAEPLRGSFGALARDFRAALAGGWTKKKRKTGRKPLAASTMQNYLRYVVMFEAEDMCDRSVAALQPKDVYKLRDAMADTPGKANNWLNVLKQMMAFSTERGWRGDNPASDISPLPIGEHEPWPADVLEAALEAASPMLRLAIVSGLCTGQRVSDVIRIQHGWLKTPILELSQVKTDVDAAIPIPDWWREEIARIERKSVTILYDRFGKPFTSEDRIQERMRVLMRQLGQVDENNQILYSFHGLRKNACCYLLENGLSDATVGLILGMTADTVRHYGKRARAYMVALGASEKVTSISRADMSRGAGGGKRSPSNGGN